MTTGRLLFLLCMAFVFGVILTNSTTAQPPAGDKKSEQVHGADIAPIAKDVHQIERKRSEYRKVEIGRGSRLAEAVNCCCCTDGSWTAYFEKGQLRKAVIDTGEGDLVEFYFSQGKLIFVAETDLGPNDPVVYSRARYYLKDDHVVHASVTPAGKSGLCLRSRGQLLQCEKAILADTKGK